MKYSDIVINDFKLHNANADTIRREFWQLVNGEYVCTYVNFDEKDVYAQLANDLIAKHINKCKYISSIKRVNNYNGTVTITVRHSAEYNKTQSVYVIKNC